MRRVTADPEHCQVCPRPRQLTTGAGDSARGGDVTDLRGSPGRVSGSVTSARRPQPCVTPWWPQPGFPLVSCLPRGAREEREDFADGELLAGGFGQRARPPPAKRWRP
jgi:hypothetical protein